MTNLRNAVKKAAQAHKRNRKLNARTLWVFIVLMIAAGFAAHARPTTIPPAELDITPAPGWVSHLLIAACILYGCGLGVYHYAKRYINA